MKRYFFNILISVDQMLNTLLGGDPDETISSRAGKRVDTCAPCRWLCRLLDVIDPRHCHKHIEPDEGRNEVI